MNNDVGGVLFAGFMMGIGIMFIAINIIDNPTSDQREVAVKEYLSHPENYAIQYVYPKGDTVCVDTIVTYLK